MDIIKDFPFLREKGHIISFVGAGGKTTLMFALAEYMANRGNRVLVTTTTHILCPEKPLRENITIIGEKTKEGKLKMPDYTELKSQLNLCHTAFIEADGAKKMPFKVPEEWEPVIIDECDIVIGVAGIDALGKTFEKGCFRYEKACRLLGKNKNDIITCQDMARVLYSDFGTRKNVGDRNYYIVINKCNSTDLVKKAEIIKGILSEKGIKNVIIN